MKPPWTCEKIHASVSSAASEITQSDSDYESSLDAERTAAEFSIHGGHRKATFPFALTLRAVCRATSSGKWGIGLRNLNRTWSNDLVCVLMPDSRSTSLDHRREARVSAAGRGAILAAIGKRSLPSFYCMRSSSRISLGSRQARWL